MSSLSCRRGINEVNPTMIQYIATIVFVFYSINSSPLYCTALHYITIILHYITIILHYITIILHYITLMSLVLLYPITGG